ncbi:hypothetical protein [Lactiplantibacillus pentosus]|uniref:hypothetical protein n=1 Tax=Lactiplantibacillus pentosus TaxID=1589 RepID=UPI003C1B98B1
MKVEKLENSISKEEMEIDNYVPVSISFPENDLEAEGLYYYRFINKEYSFVEFKINSVSKKIVNVCQRRCENVVFCRLKNAVFYR